MHYVMSIVLLATAAFAEKVGDFAPTVVGSVWEYSYEYDNSYLTQHVCRDSISIRIELLSKTISGTDTLIVLNTREQGRSWRWANDNGIRLANGTDTAVVAQYQDTAIISADSIYRRPGYRCKVVPFWRAHAVEADSVSRGISPVGDSLKYIALKYGQITLASDFRSYPDNAMYLQNIGLISSTANYLGNHHSSTSINLVSYNGTPVPTGIRQRSGRLLRQPDIASRHVSKTLRLQQHIATPVAALTLTGKRIPASGRMAPGLVISEVSRSQITP